MTEPRIVELRRGILEKNDLLAAGLRDRFLAAGVFAVNLVSSPGTGKTALLEAVLVAMAPAHRVAALVGDCATDNDAVRLRRSGAPVRQIVTQGMCHLEADMVEQHLEGWDLAGIDVLFVENVGNLVCPSSFDLGEAMRIVLLSVTEGEDKPLKYPGLFHTADLAVLTKVDLADAVDFDRAAALDAIEAVHPGLPVVETSARTGAGVDLLVRTLEARRADLTVRIPPSTPSSTP
ncbi:MAG: hydrogenase nickel incorporation protein HypB [Acidimicrobiales bacterium]|nr:hydrogenase nickel incorporation protein HypB [Acidimicrobiales bacterium]